MRAKSELHDENTRRSECKRNLEEIGKPTSHTQTSISCPSCGAEKEKIWKAGFEYVTEMNDSKSFRKRK